MCKKEQVLKVKRTEKSNFKSDSSIKSTWVWMMLLLSLLFSGGQVLAAEETNILVIGCSKSITKDRYYYDITEDFVQKQFRSNLVADELKSILQGDSSLGSINVTFQDTYAVRSDYTSAKSYSLMNHYYWPDGKEQRMKNLRGEDGVEWDYVVVMADPSMIANTPGIYARGVKLIVDQVRQGTAEPLLVAQWPDVMILFL